VCIYTCVVSHDKPILRVGDGFLELIWCVDGCNNCSADEGSSYCCTERGGQLAKHKGAARSATVMPASCDSDPRLLQPSLRTRHCATLLTPPDTGRSHSVVRPDSDTMWDHHTPSTLLACRSVPHPRVLCCTKTRAHSHKIVVPLVRGIRLCGRLTIVFWLSEERNRKRLYLIQTIVFLNTNTHQKRVALAV